MDESGRIEAVHSPAASHLVEAATAAVASPINDKDDFRSIDPCIPEDERNFYLRAYPNVDLVRERKVHCTVCKAHIGTAPAVESIIKMHPILRVTHCTKCHDFYNSGEFSKGEDGSELYCRWCGQGGEVYCCSSCPYVFCKSCITKNLSRGVVADIEQNENWNCFNCSTKILWPLRAQHWALVNYIQQQKSFIKSSNLSEAEAKRLMAEDRCNCCRLAKAKCGNMSDSLESIDSSTSRRSLHSNSSATRKAHKQPAPPVLTSSAKRAKPNNDEVVCTPDFFSMLEPDCQITETPKTGRSIPPSPANSVPRIMTIQTPATPANNYITQTSTPRASAPPPLVLRNTSIKINRAVAPQPVVRRTIVGPRAPPPTGVTTPVYHTINGYRIDLNSAAQHETFRLPNGKLIQVKRQGVATQQAPTQITATRTDTPINVLNTRANITWQRTPNTIQQTPHIQTRPVQITQTPAPVSGGPQFQQITIAPQQPQVIRYQNTLMANRPTTLNGATQVQIINGTPTAPVQAQIPTGTTINAVRPQLVRHVFPETPIGQARTQLQDKVFNAMEISVHLSGKLQTLTNSNAYKQARNYLEIKELYIHLSYLLTYGIGRYKDLQDKCLADMRQLGFVNDADCLENGQLAADKQASDDEDNEIEIVEPKTDTITLDSDNDDDEVQAVPAASTTNNVIHQRPGPLSHQQRLQLQRVQEKLPNIQIVHQQVTTPPPLVPVSSSTISTSSGRPSIDTNQKSNVVSSDEAAEDYPDFMSAAQCFLASMLEVEISEGSEQSLSAQTSPSGGKCKKQPRKKMTKKPNPQLIELERQRLEEIKRNDAKLKMKCAVKLKRVEEEYPIAKKMIHEQQQALAGTNTKKRAVSLPESNEAEKIEPGKRKCSSVHGDDGIPLIVLADIHGNIVEVPEQEKQISANFEEQGLESGNRMVKPGLPHVQVTEMNKTIEMVHNSTESNTNVPESPNGIQENTDELQISAQNSIIVSKSTANTEEESVKSTVDLEAHIEVNNMEKQVKDAESDTSNRESKEAQKHCVEVLTNEINVESEKEFSANVTKEKEIVISSTDTEFEILEINNSSEDNVSVYKETNSQLHERSQQTAVITLTDDETNKPNELANENAAIKPDNIDNKDKTEIRDKLTIHDETISSAGIVQETIKADNMEKADAVDTSKSANATTETVILNETESTDNKESMDKGLKVPSAPECNTMEDPIVQGNAQQIAHAESVVEVNSAKLINNDRIINEIANSVIDITNIAKSTTNTIAEDTKAIALNSTLDTADNTINLIDSALEMIDKLSTESLLEVNNALTANITQECAAISCEEAKNAGAATKMPQNVTEQRSTIETAGTADIVEKAPYTAAESVIAAEKPGTETTSNNLDGDDAAAQSYGIPITASLGNSV